MRSPDLAGALQPPRPQAPSGRGPFGKGWGIRLFLVVLAGALCFSSCQASPEILIPNDYRTWPLLHPEGVNYAIPGHGESLRIMYINRIGLKPGREGGQLSFPEGTKIVKEVYTGSSRTEGEAPKMLTVMIKRPADVRSRGGWLWVVKSGGSESVLPGEFCITCHANANEKHPYADKNPQGAFRDYVFFATGAVPGDTNPPQEVQGQSPGY